MAREDKLLQPKEGETNIEDIEVMVTPNVYFFLDVKTQIILIQDKKSVFEKPSTPANRISEFFENQLVDYLVDVNIKPISKAKELWVELEEAKGIFSLKLDINPPNFFGSRFRTNVDVREAYEETNFDKFVLQLKNKLGKLKIERKDFEDILQALTSGAGDFTIKLKNKLGKIVDITNSTGIRSLELPISFYNSDDEATRLESEINELDRLNDPQRELPNSETQQFISESSEPIIISNPPPDNPNTENGSTESQ